MVGEHDQPPPNGERVEGRRQSLRERLELTVDLDPQCLERALCRIPSGTAGRRRNGPPNKIGESG